MDTTLAMIDGVAESEPSQELPHYADMVAVAADTVLTLVTFDEEDWEACPSDDLDQVVRHMYLRLLMDHAKTLEGEQAKNASEAEMSEFLSSMADMEASC